MTTYVALLRGINVGKAKRVSMRDLVALLDGLGYADVRTVLQSGNAVFTTGGRRSPARIADDVRRAVDAKLGLDVAVLVRTGPELATAVSECRLAAPDRDPSRLLVAFLSARPDATALAGLKEVVDAGVGEEELQLGDRVAYLWCPAGILKSRLPGLVDGGLGVQVTARNWRTVTRLAKLAAAPEPPAA